MAGQQPVEDGRERPYVPAIPIIFAVKRDPRDKPAGDAGKWANYTAAFL